MTNKDCELCVSHTKIDEQILSLREADVNARQDIHDLWDDQKKKVPYKHFLAAISTFVVVGMGLFTIQYAALNEMASSVRGLRIELAKVTTHIEHLNVAVIRGDRDHERHSKRIHDLEVLRYKDDARHDSK